MGGASWGWAIGAQLGAALIDEDGVLIVLPADPCRS
jgi:hypothetical protein